MRWLFSIHVKNVFILRLIDVLIRYVSIGVYHWHIIYLFFIVLLNLVCLTRMLAKYYGIYASQPTLYSASLASASNLSLSSDLFSSK